MGPQSGSDLPPLSTQRHRVQHSAFHFQLSTAVTELVVLCTKVRGFTVVCGRLRRGGSIRYDVAASLPLFYGPGECWQSGVSSSMGMHVVPGFSLLQPATCFFGFVISIARWVDIPMGVLLHEALPLQISSVCFSCAHFRLSLSTRRFMDVGRLMRVVFNRV